MQFQCKTRTVWEQESNNFIFLQTLLWTSFGRMRGHLSSRVFMLFSNFINFFHDGNFIYCCHKHNHKCLIFLLVILFISIIIIKLIQCQVCCDKHQGKGLGNVMRALTETKVISFLLSYYVVMIVLFMMVDQWQVALLHLVIIKLTKTEL